MKKLLLIDGHYFLWRSYSVPFKFYSKKGVPLHVTTMYLKFIRKLIEIANSIDPSRETHIAIVFDSNSPLSKREIYDGYKANRQDISENEDTPYKHLEYIFKVLDNLKIKYFMEYGIEGDELLATIAKKFINKDKSHKCYICSIDSDFYQLISQKINLIKLGKKGSYTLVDQIHIKNLLGIKPNQYILHKSLTGDKADNIPGIPKVGPITATKIINKKIFIKLETYKDILARNKALITLNKNHRIKFNIKELIANNLINTYTNQNIFEICDF